MEGVSAHHLHSRDKVQANKLTHSSVVLQEAGIHTRPAGGLTGVLVGPGIGFQNSMKVRVSHIIHILEKFRIMSYYTAL